MRKQSILRRLMLFCGLCIAMTTARAQYIPLPDTVFAYYVNNYIAYGCVSGNATTGYLLDTNCVSQITDTMLTLLGGSIPNMPQGFSNLNGVQYFRNLHQLTIQENPNLNSLPPLTNLTHLKWLFCDQNYLTSVSTLPDSLQTFVCSSNNLSALPALPPSLLDLEVGFNPLGQLPSPLPPNLQSLECESDLLSTLPVLPDSLTDLECGYNSLTAIPQLPGTLTGFTCQQNLLPALPDLPGSLIYLDCSYNQLTALPNIPPSVTTLMCQFNRNLSCLPAGITYLFEFLFDSTLISCLPNPMTCVASSPVSTDSMPLCTALSGCPFAYNITGNVHLFTAIDCYTDSLSNGPAINGMKLNLSYGGQLVKQTYSVGARSGEYTFATDSQGVYTVTVDTTSGPFSLVCPGSLVRTDTISSTDSVYIHQDFGMQCRGVDNGVSYIYANMRIGAPDIMYIGAGDMGAFYGAACANNSSGSITVNIIGPAYYLGPAYGALTPTSVSGNTLTYIITDFGSLQYGDLNITLITDSAATLDSTICIVVSVQTDGGVDVNPSNNALAECFPVLGSFDPNLKSAYPINTVDTGSNWITYSINFQNTGNDTAYNIVIRDTLSSFLDPLSFQFLAASSRALIDIKGNAVTFTFPKINLVDSGHNEPLSHGWLQYKVKTMPNLTLGTQIKNTASIYFDDNPAIATNTTLNTVDTFESTLGERAINAMNTFSLYPDPNHGSFTLETSNPIGSEYVISDMLGNIVAHDVIKANEQSIELKDAPDGVYTLVVRGSQPMPTGRQAVRFVVLR